MYNILICDDQPDIVSALKIYLKPEGYALYESANGQQALEVLKKTDIHLVLLDIMMPVLDGITPTAKIRELSNVPIILLTAKSETEDMVLGLNVGAVAAVCAMFLLAVSLQLAFYTGARFFSLLLVLLSLGVPVLFVYDIYGFGIVMAGAKRMAEGDLTLTVDGDLFKVTLTFLAC